MSFRRSVLLRNPQIVARIDRVVAAVNAGLQSYARVKRFALLPGELTAVSHARTDNDVNSPESQAMSTAGPARQTERIRGRLVEIEVGDAQESGGLAVGVVIVGLPHEVGLRFDAKGADRDEARRHLEIEIEAYFT